MKINRNNALALSSLLNSYASTDDHLRGTRAHAKLKKADGYDINYGIERITAIRHYRSVIKNKIEEDILLLFN